MSTLTTWGYALTDVDALPGIMTLSEFNDITAGKYLTDGRVEHSIKAAASAIRNFCGWHIYPALTCELKTTLYDKAVTVSDRMILIQLPATFVSEIESITIDLPAPVSPVRTFRPGAKLMSARSMTAMFSM